MGLFGDKPAPPPDPALQALLDTNSRLMALIEELVAPKERAGEVLPLPDPLPIDDRPTPRFMVDDLDWPEQETTR